MTKIEIEELRQLALEHDVCGQPECLCEDCVNYRSHIQAVREIAAVGQELTSK